MEFESELKQVPGSRFRWLGPGGEMSDSALIWDDSQVHPGFSAPDGLCVWPLVGLETHLLHLMTCQAFWCYVVGKAICLGVQ